MNTLMFPAVKPTRGWNLANEENLEKNVFSIAIVTKNHERAFFSL